MLSLTRISKTLFLNLIPYICDFGIQILMLSFWDWPLAELAALPRTFRPRSLRLRAMTVVFGIAASGLWPSSQ